jgi:hypothetical protein
VLTEAVAVSDTVSVEVEPPLDDVTLDIEGPLFPGSTFTASAEGFQPGTLVQAFLESDPVLVGEETADAAGRVTFLITIPRDFPPGPHTVVLVGTGLDGAERRLAAAIRVNPLPGDGVPVPVMSTGALALLTLLMLLTGWRLGAVRARAGESN